MRIIQNNGDGTFTLIEGERSLTITAEAGSQALVEACAAFFTPDQ
jgi:hypothetical protein